MMTNKIIRCVFATSAVFCVIVTTCAATVTVPNGGTYTITSAWTDLRCSGSATLTVNPTAKTSDGTCWDCQTTITATNGTVTLDFSSFDAQGLPVLFRNNIRADQNGNLVFKGPSNGSVRMFFGTASAQDPHVNDPHSVAPKFGATAASVEGNVTLVFTNMAGLATTVPSALNGKWSVADDAQILVFAPDALKPVLNYGEAVTISDFDVFAMTNAAFGSATAIRVSAGRTLGLKPMALLAAWGCTSKAATFGPAIELVDTTSRLLCRNANSLTIAGAVSGPGSVELMNNAYGSTVTFSGACTFTGPLSVSTRDPQNTSRMVAEFNAGVPQWASAKDVTVGAYGQVLFNGGTFALGRVTGTDLTGDMRFGTDASVTINTLGRGAGPLVLQPRASSTTARVRILAAESGAILARPETISTPLTYDLDSIVLPYATVRAVDDTAAYLLRIFGGNAVTLPDNATYRVQTVSNETAVSVRATNLDSSAPLTVNGGTVNVVAAFDWDAEAMLHLDASDTNSFSVLTNTAGVVRRLSDYIAGQPDYPYVMTWNDTRSSQTTYRGYNDRVYQSGTYQDVIQVYMHAVTNALNGLTYFSCVDTKNCSKRMPIVAASGADEFKPAYCTMVFGSHGGGGKALLGADRRYARNARTSGFYSSKDDPITTNENVTAWLNGASVDARTTGLSGGWDIISLKLDPKVKVTALGWDSNTSDGGGQEYAEVLFFSRELNEAERRSLEMHLARKWGLDYDYRLPVSVRGTGTLAVEGSVLLKGGIRGTVRVTDGSVTYDAAPNVSAADIRGMSGVIGWFDPDDATRRIHCTLAARPLEVNAVFDQILNGRQMFRGNNLNGTSYVRAPHLNTSARGGGPERGWLDYSNCYEGRTSGNYLKFSTSTRDDISATTCSSATDSSLSTRTAFIISDSFRGGGTPIIDSAACSLKIKNRTSGPIWATGTDATVTGGKTYLNGNLVDGTTTSFTGEPELFAFEPTENLAVTHEGFYSHSEGTSANCGEMLGESIYFDRTLTDDERIQVESYLMWKWLGMTPPGLANLTGATLAGNGSVSGVAQADLPSFAADYSGTVTLSESALGFTVASGASQATDALSLPAGTLVLPASVTLTIHTPVRLKAGSYTLIDAGTLTGATTWTVGYPEMSAERKSRCTVVREGGALRLNVSPSGFLIFLR